MMTFFVLGSLSGTILGLMMFLLSVFLILLVLVQRGKGGGLTGALGGPGGQSAFGSKAGDTFTVITVAVAAIWAFTCAFTMWLLGTHAPPTITGNSTSVSAVGDDASPSTPDDLTISFDDDEAGGGLSSGLSSDDGESADDQPNMTELAPANDSMSEGLDDTAPDPANTGTADAEATESDAAATETQSDAGDSDTDRQ